MAQHELTLEQAPAAAEHWTPGWAAEPSDPSVAAPAIPAIAWWCDHVAVAAVS